MAKVTITLEDNTQDGELGLRMEVQSDPEFSEFEEEHTIAQSWSLDIADMIMSQASDVKVKEKEIDSSKH